MQHEVFSHNILVHLGMPIHVSMQLLSPPWGPIQKGLCKHILPTLGTPLRQGLCSYFDALLLWYITYPQKCSLLWDIK